MAAGVLLCALIVGVAVRLLRGSQPAVALLLAASIFGISAILFLPTRLLRSWVEPERVQRLYELACATPLRLPEWVHLFVFAWLGAIIWLARQDLRNWRGMSIISALGMAAEVSQWLTDGRTPMLVDAALNVAGGLVGAEIAYGCLLITARSAHRARRGKDGGR